MFQYFDNTKYFHPLNLLFSSVSSEDYEEFRGNLAFETCQTRACVSINSLPDGCVVERNEEFIILLSSEGPLDRIHLEQTEGRVEIIDDDGEYRSMSSWRLKLNLHSPTYRGIHTFHERY